MRLFKKKAKSKKHRRYITVEVSDQELQEIKTLAKPWHTVSAFVRYAIQNAKNNGHGSPVVVSRPPAAISDPARADTTPPKPALSPLQQELMSEMRESPLFKAVQAKHQA